VSGASGSMALPNNTSAIDNEDAAGMFDSRVCD
jgi:hypothetical protein